MRYAYSIAGPEKDKEAASRIHQSSMEAGERWMLNDVAGKPIRAWDSRGHAFRSVYDALRRPLESYMRPGTGPELLVGRTVYGETRPTPETDNLRGKAIQQFDQAGVVTSDAYDFKGNALSGQRQLAVEYKAALDWSVSVPLEAEIYASSTRFDALNRPTEVISPDHSVSRPSYNEANLLERIEANLRGAQQNGQPVWTTFVNNIDYDAKGQRTRIDYGNGARTDYSYDAQTFRLTHLQTTRPGASVCQDLYYTYDPAGNITHIRDDAQQTNYFNGQVVPPHCDYIYDAIYRLITATGREHIGQAGQPQSTWDDQFRVNLPHPGDGQAMRNYTEQYRYDAVGNFEQLVHQAANGNWTREYAYAEPSLIEPAKQSNRLSSTTVGGATEPYTFDAHGNMSSMPHLTLMQWDFRDQLSATSRQAVNTGTPETTYYTYDGAGERVRKVTERQNGSRKAERLYFGGFETYHEFESTGTGIALERETLHIMDDKQRIALVETLTQGNDGLPTQLVRYQFSNHLGSASLELNDQALIISYEEYSPYGSTAFQAVNQDIKAAAKRYRYTGKERDEETGLAYHGARYFASWLGRWLSTDPAGLVDGPCLFQYSLSNPIAFTDATGMCAGEPTFNQVMEQSIGLFKGREGFSIIGASQSTGGKWGNAELHSAAISIVGPGVDIKLTFSNGAWSYEEIFAPTLELRGGPLKGQGLPSGWFKSEDTASDATEPQSDALENVAEIAIGMTPFLGSGKDLYDGIKDGSGWKIASGIAGLALDIASLGSASLIKGGISAALKLGTKGLMKQGVAATSKLVATGSIMTKWIRNPGGKLGDALTRQTTANVVSELKARGFSSIAREGRFDKGPFNLKRRFADLVAGNPETGETLIINIGKQTKGGYPVRRERWALDDIMFSPKIRDYPNARLMFVPKGASGILLGP
jgi:RHS repeat-associated protein